MDKKINLENFTTFKIGQEPKAFFSVSNIENIKSIFDLIKEEKYFVLGGGSNILVSPSIKDYNILRIENRSVKIESNIITVGAGEYLSFLVNTAIENNLKGLEWAAGIPGTIGGAIFGNSGSFLGEIKDNLESITVFDINLKEVKILSNKDCNFSYRNSIFKENKNKYIILSAEFRLNIVDNNYEIRKIYNENLEKKRKTQPIGEFSAGCVFKNVEYDENNLELVSFLANYEENNLFKLKKQIPTAFLIDKLGLKGLKMGEAEISSIHANFIINNGKANYEDVIGLIALIKKEVKENLDVELEEEIEII